LSNTSTTKLDDMSNLFLHENKGWVTNPSTNPAWP
jgi:hypothetical protein